MGIGLVACAKTKQVIDGKSSSVCTGAGAPVRPAAGALSAEVGDLIARNSQESPLWRSERIRGELLKLRIVVSNRSIRRYRRRGVVTPGPGTTVQSWPILGGLHLVYGYAALRDRRSAVRQARPLPG